MVDDTVAGMQEQWRGPSSKLPEAQQGGEGSDDEAQRLEDGIDMIQAWLRVYDQGG